MFVLVRVAGRDPPRLHDWRYWGKTPRDGCDYGILKLAQAHFFDRMARAFPQDQLCPFAGRLDIVLEVRAVDLAPDRVRFFDGFFASQLRVAVEIGFGVPENRLAQLEEPRNVPVFNGFLVGVDVDRKIEKIADERSGSVAGLQDVESLDDQNVR